jgi:hypothetical protein
MTTRQHPSCQYRHLVFFFFAFVFWMEVISSLTFSTPGTSDELSPMENLKISSNKHSVSLTGPLNLIYQYRQQLFLKRVASSSIDISYLEQLLVLDMKQPGVTPHKNFLTVQGSTGFYAQVQNVFLHLDKLVLLYDLVWLLY